jgi:hypothetical protein
MTTTCDQYLEDPEAHAAHLESCPSCQAMFGELDDAVAIEARPVRVDALPLAPWEGASHRTWPLVLAGVVAVLVLSVVLSLAAGISPVRGITSAVTSGVTSFETAAKFFRMLGQGLHGAPALVHIIIAALFVVINTVLFFLLRRAPKGIDV